MQWHLAGAVLVVTGSGGWGYLIARQLRRRPVELRAAAQAVELLRSEIEYGGTPLPEALEHVGRRTGGPVRRLCLETSATLSGPDGSSASEAWHRALIGAAVVAAWSEPDVATLAQLGDALGATGTADQVRHIELCLARLRVAEEEASAVAATHARMWMYLGVLAGLGMVVLGV